MTSSILKASLIKSGLAASVLLFANGLAQASEVTLTAGPTTTTLPDGQTVPMWGYTCGAVSGTGVSCTAMNGVAQTGGWQPPLITVPSGEDLTITLVNALDFGVDDQELPTSLVIVGQLGGGLGAPTAMDPLVGGLHGPQGTTWPGTQGTPGACADEGTFCPPAQADRVRSFGTEVLAGSSAPLVWTAADLRPGTYLIHSGTQPSIQQPMGLYGVLVVTDATYPGVMFDDDVALLLSEIDPVLNAEVAQVVKNTGFSDTFVWSGQVGACGDVTQPATAHTCYPPVVNYSPRYYLVNGVSFDRSDSAASALAVPAAGTQTRVLLRFVNAGLRMHVPSVVGADMTLHAEDGNVLPGVPKLQTQVFLAAGKTYDVTIQPKQTNAGTYDAATYAVYDRALGLSTNNQRDGGMQAHLLVAGGAAPASTAASATGEPYYCVAGTTLAVTDPSRGVLANDTGAYGATLGTVSLVGVPPASNFAFQSNGTFTYTQLPTDTTCGGTFEYMVNGTVASTTATITQCDALIQGTDCTLGVAPTAANDSYTSNIASRLQIAPAGVLVNDTDPSGLPLKVDVASVVETEANLTLDWNPNGDGSFIATATAPGTYTFTYNVKNSQNRPGAAAATVTLTFPAPTGLVVALVDGKTGEPIDDDYRWIIEEDRTFYIDPKCQVNQRPMTDSNGNACPPLPVQSLATNFHTSHTPVVAQGCVGTVSCEAGQKGIWNGTPDTLLVCDVGNGACRPGTQRTAIDPSQVHLDATKRYYISILPRDAWITSEEEDAFGYTMGGAQISSAQVTAGPATTINVYLQKTPLETAKISVFVFQDDSPLNGEADAGGGVDQLAPNEAGLGGFNLVLLDKAGMFGDAAGQITYDMAGMPVSNSLAGTIDPLTHLDACPISPTSSDGLVGVIVTCPTYESDGVTLSPLTGHAVIANMYAGLYEVAAAPSADRIARGEKWLQTNTLDGTKDIEAFLKPGEPGYFQEFGPGGYHVAFGFANPDIINGRKTAICPDAAACPGNFYGNVTGLRMSRTPDQRVYGSGSYAMYGFGQCYVSLGAPDSGDFAFTTCDDEGNFQFNNIPTGNLRVTVFDQWNDLLVDGLSTPVKAQTIANAGLLGGSDATRMEIPVTQWRANLAGRVFLDVGCGADPAGVAGDGVSQECEPGLPLAPFNIRYRDGSYAGFNNTDLVGNAGFNEVFPFLNWLVVDIDSARHKLTGIHVVYDSGGPVDGSAPAGIDCAGVSCGDSTVGAGILNSRESPTAHLPTALRVPGARYCADGDCPAGDTAGGSTGRVDPGWVTSEGWQGLLGQYSVIEFAMKPFLAGENGGIKGLVTYAPTRPFDDPALLFQLSWAPGIPNVTVNLYQEGTGPAGAKTLKLVDTTTSSSWDDWAQGFRKDASGNILTDGSGNQIPNMNCPGQESSSPFSFTLENTRQWLNPSTPIAENSRFKCFDGWPMHNQVQPAQYNGMYKFPSVTARNPITGAPTGSNCAIDTCIANPDDGFPMLPPGKYVVEVIVPPGYEVVKEEDRNILMGDAYVGPVTQQIAGFGNIFIMPDQAAINAFYNPYNVIQSVTNNGASPMREGDTGSVEVFWPCVGATRIVPDWASLFPASEQMAAFAGASRPLCDRKEVTLNDQMAALAKFYLFTSTDVTSHFTGQITNDLSAEFDPFSPQFGEKLGVPNVPVAFRDFTGKEISRMYADQWGKFNGVTFSSWTVWPPSPSGYVPQMMITCMNDPGPIPGPGGTMITDPMYNPAYSNFCYETPFMPGQTSYMDTPVLPTMGFAGGYNLPDVEYPDTTPAIKQVNGTGVGPWIAMTGPVASVAVNNRGSGYTGVPTVGFSGGGGSGAAATAYLGVGTVTITNSGQGSYLSAAPTVTVTIGSPPCSVNGTTCVQATGTVNMTTSGTGGGGANGRRRVASVTINNPGRGYASAPSLTFSRGLASAVSSLGVSFVNVTAGGSAYATPPTVAFTGGGGSGATATAVLGTLVVDATPLTIIALGDKVVLNHAYSGPNATGGPFNQKFITRHYGFGSGDTPGTVALVGADGVSYPLTGVTWSDSQITGTVPALTAAQSTCTIQQRGVTTTTRCGQLVITAANGKKSIDTVTVTIGGKPPTYVAGPNGDDSALQTAIDNATPGDLIIVGPGTYRENVLMWKPVRLQGVGAESVTINADAHPAGKMDVWRRRVNCLFGLALNGRPNSDSNPYDPTDTYSCSDSMRQQVDRNLLEPILGWDAFGNGNLAQMLQEPTLMGAYEGAGITVLGKGVWTPVGSDQFGVGETEGAFPDGYEYLTGSDAYCNTAGNGVLGRDYGTSNFLCNPSRIDGISVINSSQGGGGIFAHAWNHNLEVSNTRIHGNHGSLTGGITIGSPEFGDPFTAGGASANPPPDGLPAAGLVDGELVGYGLNRNVRVHHNSVTGNASIGDALYSGTNSGAGGVTLNAGADGYTFNNNWVAGNLSAGDGGGVVHSGFINDGRIANNWILFNQSASATLPTNGGGLGILGGAPDRTLANGEECGTVTDLDCPPGLSDGTGRNLVIDANLIMGNSAESGTGGGLRLQKVNGGDVLALPLLPLTWNGVLVTNNIIANNVAGWDGGGVSLQDALKVRIINNTVIANDTTASAGVLFNTLGAPFAATPPPGCAPADVNPDCSATNTTTSTNQASGLVTMENTPYLVAALPANPPGPASGVLCPSGYGYEADLTDGACRDISFPLLRNNLFWQNRAFHIGVGALGGGQQNQQSVVTLYPLLNQATTGLCSTVPGTQEPGDPNTYPDGPVHYWDIGVRGDTGPTNHGSGFTLSPSNSILTSLAGGYTGNGNLAPSSPGVVRQYCNGSRLAPEGGGSAGGFIVPPGRSETTGTYPVFALNQVTAAATVDEGNNWISLGYGPLSLTNAAITSGPLYNTPLGNYDITAGSPPIDAAANGATAPNHDFFGRARPQGAGYDIGAVEFLAAPVPPPALPALTVLDNFNRTNANTLNTGAPAGVNWSQTTLTSNLLCGLAGLGTQPCAVMRVNTNQAFTLPGLTPWAIWNGTVNVFGANQGAAFSFANAPLNGTGSWLILKASGGSATTPANYIRVAYVLTGGGQVTVATTTNSGLSFTARGSLPATFALGDRLTARADATGTVFVWKTTAALVTTYVGSVAIPTSGVGSFPLATGGGRIGMLLPIGARVDNFAGGTVP